MLETCKLARIGNVGFLPQSAHDPDQLFGHFQAFLGRQAQYFELVFLDRIVGPAVTDAEIDSSSGEPVEIGHCMGQQNRVPQGRQEDGCSQAQAPRAGADRGKCRESLEPGFRGKAVSDPDRMIA